MAATHSAPSPSPSLCPHLSIIRVAKSRGSFSLASSSSLAVPRIGPPKLGGTTNLAVTAAARALASSRRLRKASGSSGVAC